MIRRQEDFEAARRRIGGGVGELLVRNKFSREETFGKTRVCAEIVLEPGQSIGMHQHKGEMELFYLLEGTLVSIGEDGGEEPFRQGDMMSTGGGASHALRNDSGADAVLLAIVIL